MTTRVVTDSASALDPALADQWGVVVVPVRINIGTRSYLDGEIGLEELADTHEEVRTAGSSPGAFAAALDGAEAAVVITVAATLSSTYRAAALAAADSPGAIEVVDSGTAAGAQALVVLEAAKLAAAGAGPGEVTARARTVADQVKLAGVLENLEWLVRGGRVSGLVGGLAGTLGVRPVFELAGGSIRRLRPAFSRDAGLNRLLTRWRRSRVEGATLHCFAHHTMDPLAAEALLSTVSSEVEPATGLVAEFGAPMMAHTGPHMAGLAWWWETP